MLSDRNHIPPIHRSSPRSFECLSHSLGRVTPGCLPSDDAKHCLNPASSRQNTQSEQPLWAPVIQAICLQSAVQLDSMLGMVIQIAFAVGQMVSGRYHQDMAAPERPLHPTSGDITVTENPSFRSLNDRTRQRWPPSPSPSEPYVLMTNPVMALLGKINDLIS